MPIFKTKRFARFARGAKITDQDLCRAAAEIQNDEYDADLGGCVFKQRVARAGGGRSGGFRTIVLFKAGNHTFFVYGFAKSSLSNISKKELEGFRKLADEMLSYTKKQLEKAVKDGALIEVECDEDEERDGEEASD